MNHEYQFERLREGNLPQLAALVRKVYRKKVTIAYLKAKYDTSYLGQPSVGYFAKWQGQYVAHVAAIPYLLTDGKQEQLSAQLADGLTVAAHQRKGLFAALNQKVYDTLKEEGVMSVFGMPNQLSEVGFYKTLKWQPIGRLHRYHIPVDKGVIRFWRRVYRTPLPWTSERPASSVAGSGLWVMRTADLYRYKSFGGNKGLLIEGLRVWLKGSGSWIIGDMDLPENEEHFSQVLSQLIELGGRAGVREIIFQSSPGSALEKMFAQRFTHHPSWLLGYLAFGESLGLEKLHCTHGDFDTF